MIVRTRLGAGGLDEAGTGVPVFWLHGYPHDRTLWAPQLAAPVAGFRYLAPDLPGFGESDRLATTTLDGWADWVAALLDTLAIDRAVIGGLSMGGYLALAMWRRHPARVRALVLADTRAGADSAEAKEKRRDAQVLARTEGPAIIAERALPGMLGKSTRWARPETVAMLDAMLRRASADAIVDALQVLMDRPDATPGLAGITVPTLIVCGEEDALTPVAESRAMQAAIPGSRMEVIPGAGHVSNLEQPAVFDRLLSEYLGATIRTGPT
jgi:pimeloyl-ACP methyl ester carboxylesterase